MTPKEEDFSRLKKENKDLINAALLRSTVGLMGPKIERRSGRNETSSLTRKKGYF